MFVNFNILNQLGSPAINSNTFANRPAAGQTGRLFVSTDTYEIYRDNGTSWDLIGGPGSSTITGTGTATQVAYFTSSQAIGSSANLFWDNANARLGIGTATPGASLDVHGTGTIVQVNSTGTTNNGYLAFQRTGTTTFSIGDTYNGGTNYFRIFGNTLAADIVQIFAATGKTVFQATQAYTTGLARGNYFDFNLSVAAGGSFSSPNAITALGASLDLTLAGNATIPSGARSGLDAYNSIAFTGAGTLTHTQGTQIRAYSNVTAGWAFNGSAVGTITHLAGLRALFPDNSGSAVNVTNNYALLLNDQTANTGTVTYTNRWGVYQEGASDLNYMAANLLLGSTTNNGNRLQVTGISNFTGNVAIGMTTPTYNLDISSTGATTIRTIGAGDGYTQGNLLLQSGTTGSPQSRGLGIYTFNEGTDATWYFGNGYGYADFFVINRKAGTTWNASAAAPAESSNFFSITNAGLVGIGTVTPSVKLEIVGDYRQKALVGNSNGFNLTINSSTDVVSLTNFYNAAMTFGTNNTERARFTAGGNFLIGTTTDAGYKLQVNGPLYSTGTGFSTSSATLFLNNSTAVTGRTFGVNSSNTGLFQVFDLTSGNTTRLVIDSTGNVGINTSVPAAKLEVNGDIKTAAPNTGTAAAWKLGSRVAATVVVNTTEYIEVDIGGTLYKLATVT